MILILRREDKRMKMKKSVLIVAIASVSAVTIGYGAVINAHASNNKKVVKISYWHVNAQTQGGASVDTLVKDFNKTHKYIKVTAKYNPNMYQGLMQNLQSAQASGKVPDIVQVGWAYTNYFADNFKYLTPTSAQKNLMQKKLLLIQHFLNIHYLLQKIAKVTWLAYLTLSARQYFIITRRCSTNMAWILNL